MRHRLGGESQGICTATCTEAGVVGPYAARKGARGVKLSGARRDQLIDDLAHRLDSWSLTTPAIAFLEVHKPLSFVASQSLLALQPLLGFFLGDVSLGEYATLLEEPRSLERVISRLEELQQGGTPSK